MCVAMRKKQHFDNKTHFSVLLMCRDMVGKRSGEYNLCTVKGWHLRFSLIYTLGLPFIRRVDANLVLQTFNFNIFAHMPKP